MRRFQVHNNNNNKNNNNEIKKKTQKFFSQFHLPTDRYPIIAILRSFSAIFICPKLLLLLLCFIISLQIVFYV